MNQNLTKDRTCKDFQTYMEEYIAGELDAHIESEFTTHLTTCDSCQHEFGLAQAIDTVLDDLPKPTAPPDILRNVTSYIQAHPSRESWIHNVFHLSTILDYLQSPLLHISAFVCLIGIAVFGVHQHQQHVKLEQATRDFNYAISKMNYAVQKTNLAVNDSFGALKIEEAPRRALKPTVKISTAINRSLGILNYLTGDAPNLEDHQNSDTITSKNESSGGFPTETTSPIPGGKTQ